VADLREVAVGRIFMARVAWLFLFVVVLLFSVLVGTALSSIIFRAVEL
jgi:hypothetical protein